MRDVEHTKRFFSAITLSASCRGNETDRHISLSAGKHGPVPLTMGFCICTVWQFAESLRGVFINVPSYAVACGRSITFKERGLVFSDCN